MRRSLSIALASLFVAALLAPTAQAATRRYDFQGGYSATVGVNCDPPIYNATALSGSNIYGTDDYTRIKMRKGSFTYSYSSEIFTGGAPGNISATASGKMITRRAR